MIGTGGLKKYDLLFRVEVKAEVPEFAMWILQLLQKLI